MANKKFLETYPLYRKFLAEDVFNVTTRYHGNIINLKKPSLNEKCPNCNSIQTYNMVNDWGDSESNPENNTFHIVYLCEGCNFTIWEFFILFYKDDQDNLCMLKVGQNPAWSIDLDNNLEDVSGAHSDFYQKGLICESQSYGIGAYAYFRRITDEIIDSLLDSIKLLIPEDKKEEYDKALHQTKTTYVAQDKINLVKDLLPKSLQPNGMNPLGIIYKSLSEGIHSKNDDECLEDADLIKNSLVYLLDQVKRTDINSQKFTESMKIILDKKIGNKRVDKN